jgi:hypothetical protein
MPSFLERRKPISQTAATLAILFGLGLAVALVSGGVPTWQNHGPDVGPGLLRRAVDPGAYYSLTALYGAFALIASVITFFRFPGITITHIRLLFLLAFLLLISQLIYALTKARQNAELEEPVDAELGLGMPVD